MKWKTLIVDLDSTFFDDTHRRHLIPTIAGISGTTANWEKYHQASEHDTANEEVVAVVAKWLDKIGHDVIFSTGRSQSTYKKTLDAIESELHEWDIIPGDKITLHMRPVGDTSHATELKFKHIANLDRTEIAFALDDNPQNCAMYRQYGILAFQYITDITPPYDAEGKHILPAKARKAPEIIQDCLNIFKARSKQYGKSYLKHGEVMMALYPDGVVLDSVVAHQRFGIINMLVSKMCRYAADFDKPHADSLHDTTVYAAILAEIDEQAAVDWKKMEENK